MTGALYERELKHNLSKQGWLVIRGAGSLGIDLIAIKPTGEYMLIEVKSTKEKTFYTTRAKNKEQFDMLNNLAKEGFNVYYFIRWKGNKEWDKYQLPLEPYPIFRRVEK